MTWPTLAVVSATNALEALALVLGAVWLLVNVYFLYPLARAAAKRLVGLRLRTVVVSELTSLPDEDLPRIDVLLPAYDEADVIGHSLRAIRAADFPAEKLDVHVLVEPDDSATREALSSLDAALDFEEVVVPEGYPGPRNKPRALDYGYAVSDAPIVGVLDAEDIVAPDLFRVVVSALVAEGKDYVQGHLDAANEDDGLLNLLYRGEYGLWHGLILPNLWRADYPVPLGGTTNFFHRETLEDAGAARERRYGPSWDESEQSWLREHDLPTTPPWDPYNVTEDFELGLLLWLEGASFAIVDVTTREESPLGWRAWLRQRTRWEKGKLYTLRGYLRKPPRGRRGWPLLYVQALTPHIGPLNVLGVLVLLIYATLTGFEPSPLVAIVLLGGAALAGAHMLLHGYGYYHITDRRGTTRAVRTAANVVGLPFYWVLEWAAEIRAIWHLLNGRLGWEKTTHYGRHIDLPSPLASDVPAASAEADLTVTSDETGWTWRLAFGDDVVESARTYPTEAAARASLADVFSAASPEERRFDAGTDAVFRIMRTGGGWTWRLLDGAETMAEATTTYPSATAALDAVDSVRVDASTEQRLTGGRDGSAIPTPRTDA